MTREASPTRMPRRSTATAVAFAFALHKFDSDAFVVEGFRTPTSVTLRAAHYNVGRSLPRQNRRRQDHISNDGSLKVSSLDEGVALTVNSTAAYGDDHSMDWLEPTIAASLEQLESVLENPDALHDGIVQMDDVSGGISPPMETEATTVAEEAERKSKLIEAPTLIKIMKFSLPAIGVWLCSPVLSMIDTASVGLLAGTAQQAALNPAISVTDYGAILVAFMYTATTNLIAAARGKDANVEGNPETTKTLITALKLAAAVGVGFGIILLSSSKPLLKMIIGNDSINPAVFDAALRYVRIRCLGMPAAVIIGTSQSACLGMQDVRSPLYVLAAAAIINFFGDMLLVRNSNPWLGGAAGAAWATVLSQYGALFMFAKWLTAKYDKAGQGGGNEEEEAPVRLETSTDDERKSKRSAVINVTKGIMKLTGKSKVGKARRKVFRKKIFSSVSSANAGKDIRPTNSLKKEVEVGALARGFLHGKFKPSDILRLRSIDKLSLKKFLPFVVPVTTTSIGRVSGYVTMSHVASSALSTRDMAAHQIAISIFCCIAPIVDALNQVAQSFVPGIFQRERSKERALALRRTSINFAKVGALFGGIIVALVACVPMISGFFTSDPEVLLSVNAALPAIAVFLGFDGLMCSSEGTLLGQQDLNFLRNMYASFFFIVPWFMLRLKRRALSGIPVGIGTMWGTFAAYEVIRTILWMARVAYLQFRTEREVSKEMAEGV